MTGRLAAALLVLAVVSAPAIAGAGGGDGDGSTSKIIFVNRCVGGCQVRLTENNNAISNDSQIPVGTPGQVFTISEFVHGDQTWDAIMACVRAAYEPFDVQVVDEDPGSVPHHEAIAAGLDEEIGRPGCCGGIAGSYGIMCDPINNVISYSFLNGYGRTQVEDMCATILQESAHSFGLPDHLYDCTDPMTYLTIGGASCGQPFFRNKQMPCGEFTINQPACSCGGTRVNTHVHLLRVFGDGTAPPPPELAITRPLDGDTIADGTGVVLTASDPRGVSRVELHANGWLWDTWDQPTAIEPPYTPQTSFLLELPADFPDGVIDLEIRAFNDLLSMSAQTVTVTKGAPCSSADGCYDGQQCQDGRCFWPPPTGEVGDACTFAEECLGPEIFDGRCETEGGQTLCTRDCFTGINDDCPGTFACRQTNAAAGTGVCWPTTTEDPGCCSTGGGASASQLVLLGLVGGVALRKRRRRRAARPVSSC